MSVQARVTELRNLLEDARAMPMSASVVVNKAEMLEALQALVREVESETSEATQVLADRDTVLADARGEADRILEEARRTQEQLVSDTDVVRLAQQRAEDEVSAARVEAEALRREADEYVDGKLAEIEVSLERTLEAVRRGRGRLADRSDLDGDGANGGSEAQDTGDRTGRAPGA